LATVQDALFAAIEAITGRIPQRFAAAGRTDAGVHALGQVVAFDTDGTIPIERVARALNAHLPPDVSAVGATEVGPEFHPRYDALAKEYTYTVHAFAGGERQALLDRWSLPLPGPLDIEAMGEAARTLVGRRDLSAFQDVGRPVADAARTIFDCRVEAFAYHEPPFTGIPVAQIVVRADGFLLHMVRVIAGTLVDVGHGRFAVADVLRIAAARDRQLAGPTLPPRGLCLMRVEYPETVTCVPATGRLRCLPADAARPAW
jgi:tRNA pseudouridine38-40 synthase